MSSALNTNSTRVNTAALVAGKWPMIFGACFHGMNQNGKHQPCPICGGKDRFRLFADWTQTGGAICNQCGSGDGFHWIKLATGGSYPEACRYVEQILGYDNHDRSAIKIDLEAMQAAQRARENERLTKLERMKPQRHYNLMQVWSQSHPIESRQVALDYLRNRGLGDLITRGDLPQCWRVVDSLAYQDDDTRASYSALVAPAVLNNQLVNIHRTYLTDGGQKAPVSDPKKLMPPLFDGATKGAAIQLYSAGSTLAIAEGIETALAVRVARPELSVWATINDGGMASLILPGQVDTVFIMADLDRSGAGQRAAYRLQRRLQSEGRTAVVCLPEVAIPAGAKGVDWLDVLNQEVAL